MDQQPWNFEELHGSADPDLDSGEAMTEYQTGIFYVALKLALDRLKHYPAATVN